MTAAKLDCPKCSSPLEEHEMVAGVCVYACPACFGVMYDKEVLAVPLKLGKMSPTSWKCPRCKAAMESGGAYDGSLVIDRCAACGAVWFDAGEIQILRKLTGVENVAGRAVDPEEPAEPEPQAPKGALARPTKTDDEPASPKLVPPEMSNAKNPDAAKAPTVTLDGREYQHFQTSAPVTTAVYGEFPWIAQIGDVARMRDFIDPPFMLSQEVTTAESVWSAGEYVEPEEIWAAFAMPGSPPAKVGVAPAQPNPWSDQMGALWLTFAAASVICFGAFAGFAAIAANKTVYEGNFAVTATDAERSRVSEVFDIPGRTSNLEVTLATNLDGHYSYVNMALIDADTDRAYDFGREVSYYHGVEDGESWSEGASYETFIVPSVPKGRYYVRVEPETDAPQLNLRVVMRRDVPLLRIPLIAILLLLLPALWGGIRSSSFENERWMDSDHPRTSSDGDDD